MRAKGVEVVKFSDLNSIDTSMDMHSLKKCFR
jgi:hypothetical protein